MLALMTYRAWTLRPVGLELQGGVGLECIMHHWLAHDQETIAIIDLSILA